MIVAVTMYTATLGAPLFCGGIYSPTAEWIAYDFAVNGGQCGDSIRITDLGGQVQNSPPWTAAASATTASGSLTAPVRG